MTTATMPTATAGLTRSERVRAMLVVVAVLSAVDLLLTLHFMTGPGLHEQNPVARWLVDATNSAWALAAFKIVLTSFGVGVLYALRRRGSAECGTWIALAVMLWLMLRWGAYVQVAAAVDPSLFAIDATTITPAADASAP